jgi:hypothetical protein
MALQIVFVNKTSKGDQTIYQHYKCSIAGTHATISANFVQKEQYSMVAALSLDRYKAVDAVSGLVDGEQFLNFIVNIVIHCIFYLF